MPLFQKHKPLPLEGLLKSELVESDAFLEGHGIPKKMANQDVEATRQRVRVLLEARVNRNHFNKMWVYNLLSTLYFSEGKLKETVALCLRAALEHPTDPRAYYCLGAVYYGLSQETDTEKSLAGIDVKEFVEQNQQPVQAFRNSKPAESRDEAAKLAMKYFHKTLMCNISNEDKRRVQTHIRRIEVQLSL
jgi:tetratricopeptide (TPR) repeat protein